MLRIHLVPTRHVVYRVRRGHTPARSSWKRCCVLTFFLFKYSQQLGLLSLLLECHCRITINISSYVENKLDIVLMRP
jgi:hypothetical protein